MSRHSPQAKRDRYMRWMRILRVGLPLLALMILSSLFLFSRSISMQGALPFADVDLQDRLREPKMTLVRISTATEGGAGIDITANSVVPIDAQTAKAKSAVGTLTSQSGQVTTLTASDVLYRESDEMAALTGGVLMTSAGYEMTTRAIDVDITNAQADSRGSVVAVGPLGRLDAGRMRLKQNAKGAVIVFKSGVRLIYTPKAEPQGAKQ